MRAALPVYKHGFKAFFALGEHGGGIRPDNAPLKRNLFPYLPAGKNHRMRDGSAFFESSTAPQNRERPRSRAPLDASALPD